MGTLECAEQRSALQCSLRTRKAQRRYNSLIEGAQKAKKPYGSHRMAFAESDIGLAFQIPLTGWEEFA
ncbi:hypothetical protein PSCICL_08810 [Pseudomonas cichorii]|nr:hypothetical protein PSCICE_31630 [Pseudomonas cichorii]GFM69889.1 hypothetical protein PSCICL_08810 [Pseudomonas cichorii]